MDVCAGSSKIKVLSALSALEVGFAPNSCSNLLY